MTLTNDHSHRAATLVSKSAQSRRANQCIVRRSCAHMDHNESLRKFERLMETEGEHARDAAIELESLLSLLPTEKSRQLAQMQVKASHKQAKEFRELAQKVKET